MLKQIEQFLLSLPWTGFLSPLLSTLVGALLAFTVNLKIQKHQRKNQNKAAGNAALAILAKQYGDFLIFRAGLRHDLTERQNFPPWLQLRPTLFRFSENLKIDISSMAFLSDIKHPDVIKMLMIVDSNYHELGRLIEKNSNACDSRDVNISNITSESFGPWDISIPESAIGARDRALLTTFNSVLQQRARDDFQAYRESAQLLTTALKKIANSDEILPFDPVGVKKGIEDQNWAD